jgi:hypothetical protein
MDRNAMLLEPTEQRIDERLVLKQVVPVFARQIRGNYRARAVVALVHQAEEGIGLCGLEYQVGEFINQ